MRLHTSYTAIMKKPAAPIHVAKIERSHGGKTYVYHFLRTSYREGGKVKHRTLGNLSSLPLQTIETIRRTLRGDALLPVGEAVKVLRSRPHGHVAATLGVLRELGVERMLGVRPTRLRALCVAMIVARIVEPRSKLATVRGLQKATLRSTLGEMLGVDDADENELYEALDWLLKRQKYVEESLADRHLSGGSLVLYDLTSTWITGKKCPLARRGHSRDHRSDLPQVVFGLLTDREGRPIAVEVFPGNTADPNTVAAQIRKLKEKFGLEHVVLVGDRGMLTAARLREDLAPHGIDWISAMRSNDISALRDNGTLQQGLFDQRDLAEVTDPDYPGERLVVCFNDALASERKRKRIELLAATERDLDKVVGATLREKRPLCGKDKIALRVGRVVGRYKMAKHFKLTIGDKGFAWQRNEANIDKEAALDGIYVVRTSVKAEALPAKAVVESYKSLANVERAFRSMKTVDLEVRPIFHRTEDRVRAHIFLCMLAYYVQWHMRQRLAPLLFDDEDKAAAAARRASPVKPAKVSLAAERKARDKVNAAGEPAQSFRSLLGDLSTLAKVRLTVAGQEFDRIAEPTALQARALSLLRVEL